MKKSTKMAQLITIKIYRNFEKKINEYILIL